MRGLRQQWFCWFVLSIATTPIPAKAVAANYTCSLPANPNILMLPIIYNTSATRAIISRGSLVRGWLLLPDG